MPNNHLDSTETGQNGDAKQPLAVSSLTYAYPGSLPVISDFTLNLPRGSRCLLLGANGAGVLLIRIRICACSCKC